jgi:hypothetical protein
MANSDQYEHYETPTKAKIRGAVEFLEAKGIPHYKSDVFRHFNVTHRRGWAMLSKDATNRRRTNTELQETRGRPPKITNQQLKEMDRIIKEEGYEARKLSWLDLAYEAGIEGVSTRTISKAMANSMEYTKCIACQKSWCKPSTAKARKAWAESYLSRYPNPEDWYRVRFSNEVHWAVGPQGSIYIIRRPGERYRGYCI